MAVSGIANNVLSVATR